MGTTVSVKEKRKHPRAAVAGHLRYRRLPVTAKGLRNAAVRDVSIGGFRFCSDEMLSRNASLLLELHVPGSNPVHSLATVAWVKAMPGDNGFEVGGRFVEPGHQARTALQGMVLGR